jgi:hypothetical protein
LQRQRGMSNTATVVMRDAVAMGNGCKMSPVRMGLMWSFCRELPSNRPRPHFRSEGSDLLQVDESRFTWLCEADFWDKCVF